MEELTRTNDPVLLSWLTTRLAEEEIKSVVFDAHMSVAEGSISVIQRRIMVDRRDLFRARALLAEAERIATGHCSE